MPTRSKASGRAAPSHGRRTTTEDRFLRPERVTPHGGYANGLRLVRSAYPERAGMVRCALWRRRNETNVRSQDRLGDSHMDAILVIAAIFAAGFAAGYFVRHRVSMHRRRRAGV